MPVREGKPPGDWLVAVRSTIEHLRATGKKLGEPETITNKKVEAIEAHDPREGPIVVVNIGVGHQQIFEGITIRNFK